MSATAEERENVGLLRPTVVVGTVAVLVAALVFNGFLQRVEAQASARLLTALGVAAAHAVGNTVLFGTGHGLAGYDVTLGCSALVLVVPFFLVTAGLLSIARISAIRALTSLACAVAVIIMVNQLRLFAIGTGMHAWGARIGYSRTHVLVGTIISTTGLALAGVTYLLVLVGARRETGSARRG